ncbi:hypothetical protein PAPHI01_2536 [Pancytospora philotis]|nr:hypothetical protein PAPHI01_2536 [Pancytospora philotis]
MQFTQNSFQILSNFTLLEYSATSIDDFSTAHFSTTLVGLDGARRLAINTLSSDGQSVEKTGFVADRTFDSVANVITQQFHSGAISYLVSTRTGSGFSTDLYNAGSTTPALTHQSSALPFIVTNPDDLSRPLVAFSSQDSVNFYRVEPSQLVELPKYKIQGSLSPRHSSAFVDLTGDLQPNLALNMVTEGNNYLAIHDFHTAAQGLVQRLPLPRQIGPTLFYDLSNSLAFDLVYVSVENNFPYLNIHTNLCSPRHLEDINKKGLVAFFDGVAAQSVYKEQPDVKINLVELLDGMPVLEDSNGTPTGLFMEDLDANGAPTIFITMLQNNEQVVRALHYAGKGKLAISKYDKHVAKHKNVLSVSAADLLDRGKLDLIINRTVDGKPILQYERIDSPDDNCKLTVKTIGEGAGAKSYLPGVSYLACYEDESSWRKTAQLTSTGYPSLQSKNAYIGLGPTKFFLSYLFARTNCSKGAAGHFIVRSVIIPNTSVVLYVSSEKWTVRSYLLGSKYSTVAFCLVGFLVVNVFLLIYMAINEARSNLGVEVDNIRLKPMFSAL